VVGLCLLDPYTSFMKWYGWHTEGAFPEGAVFLLVFFTIAWNFVFKLIRRSWVLRQAELMLIWCMLIVAATVPSEGLMSYWFPTLTAPTYLARRADIAWKDTALANAPEGLMVSKDPRSPAVQQYFEGRPEGGRFPWKPWILTIGNWLIFMAFIYLATFFLCAILRKQWVERERLQFALARVPLEFTQESRARLLPDICYNRAFLLGVVATAAFRFLRALPLFFGAENPWAISIPFKTIFQDTPLNILTMYNVELWLIPIGFAYLVPADVSFSIWGFYWFGRVQLLGASYIGSSLYVGGQHSPLLRFEQAGAYLTFAAGSLFMARRHIVTVIKKAIGMGRGVDDSAEPVGYRLSFWGLLVCSLGGIGWFVYFGMQVWVAAVYFAFLMVIMLVHARVVAQSGMYVPRSEFQAPNILHSMGFGVFSPAGAVLAQMQWTSMMGNTVSLLGPPAIHAFRISDVFDRFRRLLLPAMLIALFVGIIAASYITLQQAYKHGALNFSYTWATTGMPQWRFQTAHQWIERPTQVTQGVWKPFVMGIGITAFVMFMRARFYWWPIHAIGLVTISSDHIERVWLPFLLGWLVKLCLVKFGTGRIVRAGRFFFIGLILTEASLLVVSSVLRTLSKGVIPAF
jgi:hypothetical protein